MAHGSRCQPSKHLLIGSVHRHPWRRAKEPVQVRLKRSTEIKNTWSSPACALELQISSNDVLNYVVLVSLCLKLDTQFCGFLTSFILANEWLSTETCIRWHLRQSSGNVASNKDPQTDALAASPCQLPQQLSSFALGPLPSRGSYHSVLASSPQLPSPEANEAQGTAQKRRGCLFGEPDRRENTIDIGSGFGIPSSTWYAICMKRLQNGTCSDFLLSRPIKDRGCLLLHLSVFKCSSLSSSIVCRT